MRLEIEICDIKKAFHSRKLSYSTMFLFSLSFLLVPLTISMLSLLRGVDRASDSRLIYFNKWVIRSRMALAEYVRSYHRGFSSGKGRNSRVASRTGRAAEFSRVDSDGSLFLSRERIIYTKRPVSRRIHRALVMHFSLPRSRILDAAVRVSRGDTSASYCTAVFSSQCKN